MGTQQSAYGPETLPVSAVSLYAVLSHAEGSLERPIPPNLPKEAEREEFNHVQESCILEQGRVAQGPVRRRDPCPRNLYGFNGNFPASLWLTDLIL